jgi:hypothetical protein
MSRRAPVVWLALASVCAVALTSCAGADQQGSPAHRMSVWVSGTGLGQEIGTLVADNARIAKVAGNGSGALHAACSTIVNDAEMANSSLPSPDPTVTDLLTEAYGIEGDVGNGCYGGASDHAALTLAERKGVRADALYRQALTRIRAVDGHPPATTTTVGNTGDSGVGGIFG